MKKKIGKKKAAVKTKSKVRARRAGSGNSAAAEENEVKGLLLKVLERLDSLEMKIERGGGNLAVREDEEAAFTRAEVSADSAPVFTPQPEFSEDRDFQENAASGGNNTEAAPQNSRRRGRPVFQAVCAECKVSCEIPFKPTGERPVYCKKCFAERKKGKKSAAVQPPAVLLPPQPRIVKVIPNGVGRVTIREMMPAGGALEPAAVKKKPHFDPRQKNHFKSSRSGRFNGNR